MDDFLHNLRSGKLKQHDRNRRDYDKYKGSQRRTGSERRRGDYHRKPKIDHLELIKETLAGIAKSREKFADAYASRSAVEERKAIALEDIAMNLKALLASNGLVPETPAPSQTKPAPEKPPETVADAPETAEKTARKLTDADKQPIFKMISDLRDKNESWEQIARHLESEKIPTLSGKGKWRGQVAKKLYDKMA